VSATLVRAQRCPDVYGDVHTCTLEQAGDMSTDALIDRFIAQDPYRSGAAEAVIAGFGVSVWAVVGHLMWTNFDVHATAQSYELPVEAVQAALAYYQRHKCEIDARLEANTIATR
jgi:uncharacterized protein (DUF433 family)